MARLLVLAVLVPMVALGSRCAAADAPTFDYDHGPTRVLFIISTTGGFASQLQELTALPDFVLYGDGTAVWTRYDKQKDLRRLMTARLSPDEVAQELAFVESAGFASWYDRYEDTSLQNLPTTTMTLHLKKRTTTRMVYGLNIAMKQKTAPEGFGQIVDHFSSFRHKDEYDYPIDRVRLFARKLSKAEAKRGYKSLGWGIKQVKLGEVAHDSEDFGQKDLEGADAERVVKRLRDWTLFSTDLSVIFFKEKKDDYQVGYRPLLPHE
jgi:hypothetical protein